MAEQLGKLIICDRCDAKAFVKLTGTDKLDGGYTSIDKFEKPPVGWHYSSELTMRLCPKCSSTWHDLIRTYKECTREATHDS